MDPELLNQLIEEAAVLYRAGDTLGAVQEAAFPEQRRFIDDPSRHKALHCTRRAAKSFTAGLYMVETALRFPGSNCLFVGLTRQSALDIIMKDILKVVDRSHQLSIHFNNTSLDCTFPNGSVIRITGVDVSEDEMNKLLGKKYKLVCIDEASLYTVNLRHLVYDILGPAMADQRGTICLFGTSSNFTQGLFFDITTGKEPGWSIHKWSALQNPHIDWQAQLDDIRANRPLYMETPQFRQWYLNEWVIETDKLVYKFNPDRNLFRDLPVPQSKGWHYVLSCDLGWEDDTAIVLSAYHDNEPTFYILRTFAQKHMTFDMVEKKLLEFIGDPKYPVNSVIIDGANKQGVETMTMRSNILFEYADKLGKADHIEILNGDLIQGKVKIHESEHDLIDEMMALVWKTNGDKIVYPKKRHPSLPNHRCFVAGTHIQANFGSCPIERIIVGDQVLTRNGLKPVISAGSTGVEPVIELSFSNGRTIVCTLDHPIYTQNRGFVCAQDLKPTDSLFSLMDLNFTDIRTREDDPIESISIQSFKEQGRACTDTFTKRHTDPSPRDGMFITKTMIRGTTIFLIWKQWIQKRMHGFMMILSVKKLLKSVLIKLGTWLNLGIHQRLDGSGILNTLRNKFMFADPLKQTLIMPETEDSLDLMMKLGAASSVSKSIEPTNTPNKNAAVYLVQRKIGDQKRSVFNLTVADDHEYFANGILVSNCDAMLYGWFNGYHFLSTPAKKALMPGTPEYIKEQEDLHKQSIMERIQREQAMKDPNAGIMWQKSANGVNPWNEW